MNRIGIVILGYPLGVSSSIICTAKTLAEEGFSVDILIDAKTFRQAPIEFPELNINVVKVGMQRAHSRHRTLIADAKSHLRHRKVFELLKRLKKVAMQIQYFVFRFLRPNYGVKDFVGTYCAHLSQYLEILGQRISQEDYVALIGIEAMGLLLSCYAIESAGAQGVHLIYYNLELMQHDSSMGPRGHLLKDVEITCSRRCDFTVLPDENRGKIFAKANGIEEAKIKYLPISTFGNPIARKSRYFTDLFNIPDDKKIILYAGNIIPWAMCREIVESVDKWPSDCVLVMHTWRKDIASDDYYRELVNIADPDRVYFSTEPVAYERLPEALSSADVGLLFYKAIDANFTEIGSSSNKLAQYVRVGLPVISNDLPSIREVFDKHGNGICVEHPDQIGDALEAIFGDYDRFRQGAFNSYRSHYSFSEAFRPILSELKEMSESDTQDSY